MYLDTAILVKLLVREQDSDFYHGKWQACRYFFVHELPKVDAWLELVGSLDTTTIDMRDAWF